MSKKAKKAEVEPRIPLKDLKLGMRVFWNDPNDDISSCYGKIIDLPDPDEVNNNDDGVIGIEYKDAGGGVINAYLSELSLSPRNPEKKYILTGDIIHAGRVEVSARSLEEAIDKAEDGDFKVVDEVNKDMKFEFCGDEDGGVQVSE